MRESIDRRDQTETNARGMFGYTTVGRYHVQGALKEWSRCRQNTFPENVRSTCREGQGPGRRWRIIRGKERKLLPREYTRRDNDAPRTTILHNLLFLVCPREFSKNSLIYFSFTL